MDNDKKAKFFRIWGFIVLGLALLLVTIAILAMVEDKKVSSGGAGIAIASALVVNGITCLRRGKRNLPPDA